MTSDVVHVQGTTLPVTASKVCNEYVFAHARDPIFVFVFVFVFERKYSVFASIRHVSMLHWPRESQIYYIYYLYE